MKKALIIDGNNLIFKAYYATAYHGTNLQSLQGIPTNALYAFIRMLNKFISENSFDALFVAFDAGKTTFRNKIFSDYKAKRTSTPEELLIQLDLVKQYLDLAEIPWSQEINFEADDLIGTISKNKDAKEYEINIISSDKDLYQLISDNIKILQPKKGLSDLKIMDKETLNKEDNLRPEQITDWKGLVGDASDNLSGIKGIGPKTALKLLQEYNTLENIIANCEKLPKKEQELIKVNSAAGVLTKELATINLNVPLKKTLSQCHYDVNLLKKPELQSFYQKYNMKTLINSQEQVHSIKNSQIKILESWNSKFNALKNFIWTEICWTNYHHDLILAIVIKNEFGTFYCNKDMIKNSKEFQSFLTNKQYQKITWDIKKNIIAIKNNYNVIAEGFIFDHMLASYLLFSNENITLENIASKLQIKNYSELSDDIFYGKGVKKQVPEIESKIAQYLELKINFLSESYQILIEKLKTNNNWNLYQKIELPAVYSLITMEINGVLVDREKLKEISQKTKIALEKTENEINQITQKNINLNSPKQISQYLFEELKLSNPKKGSTSYAVLVSLKKEHKVIPFLIEYRKLQKLYATYLNGLEKYIFPDNKIHTIYNQVQTSTGRLSSSEPNMQNITVRDSDQKEVRKIFVASNKNLRVISCDYSQIELRILAHISDDTNLINAFLKNHDIHAETASKIFNINLNEVTKEQRNKAKAVNFGIVYGISSFGLSQQLKITMQEAKDFIEKYFLVFPKIKDYINASIEFCKENGYVETMFHRKRTVPEIHNNNPKIKEFGQRIAMNMPIQGSAADIIKLAMITIDNKIKEKKIKANLIAQIHDELIFEIEATEVQSEMKKISTVMNSIEKLKVPLVINTSSGNNWYDLK